MALRLLTNPTLKKWGFVFLVRAVHQSRARILILNQPIFLDKTANQNPQRLDES